METNIAIARPQNNYSKLANEVLRDKSLSACAIAVYARVMTLPDDWNFQIEAFANIFGMKVREVRAGISELEKAGYMRRIRIVGERGRFTGWKYAFGGNLTDLRFTDSRSDRQSV